MSERGSFVTEWMYCNRCFQCVKEVLGQSEKHLTGIAIPWPHDNNLEMPIVAGRSCRWRRYYHFNRVDCRQRYRQSERDRSEQRGHG